MIPNFVTPPNSVDVQVFSPKSSQDIGVRSANGTVWNKPPGTSMVWLWAVGAGAAGSSGNPTINRGGAGGQGGGFFNSMMPAMFVPDSMTISFTTTATLIIDPNDNMPLLQLAAVVSTSVNTPFNYFLNSWSYTRAGGTAGGNSLASSSGINASVGSFFNAGGAGGGGTNATGGAVPSILGYPALTSAAVSTAGQAGYNFFTPLPIFYPGAGGAGSTGNYANTQDGRGGKGGIGCGGGGGGGDTTTVGAAGAGGSGGDPLIIILSW